MLKGLTQAQREKAFPENTILLGYRGSVAHGTYTKQFGTGIKDDKDLMGAYVAPREYYFGLPGKRRWEQREFMEVGEDGVEWDSVVYEIRKIISLLLKCNPNVLSLLWLPDELYVVRKPEGQQLIDQRQIFVSKAAYHSFAGYASGQLKRMTAISTGKLGLKRKELVAKFGYDTKNAGHLIRLLRMCIEFLTEGELFVNRKDAVELIDIKNGKWSLVRVEREAEELSKLAREAYVRSPLPPQPNFQAAEELLMEVIEARIR